jgi:C4-dicarboxylate-specific signal transduction histidine kinase
MVFSSIDAVVEQAEDHRRIECAVSSLSEWTEIVVADSGAGFTREVAAHAFDPFFTTKQKGTGLGLSIAYEILHAHDGQLTLSNGPSGGAVVTLRLPGADNVSVEPPTAHASGSEKFHA